MAGRLAGRIQDFLKLSPDELGTIRKQAIAEYPNFDPDQWQRLHNYAKGEGLNVVTSPYITPGYGGKIYWDSKQVVLSPKLDKGKTRVLGHELGHWSMGHPNDYRTLPEPLKELEAESVAFGIGHRMGVPEDANLNLTASYIAQNLKDWQGDDPMQHYQRVLPRIAGTVQRILS